MSCSRAGNSTKATVSITGGAGRNFQIYPYSKLNMLTSITPLLSMFGGQ